MVAEAVILKCRIFIGVGGKNLRSNSAGYNLLSRFKIEPVLPETPEDKVRLSSQLLILIE